LGYAASGVLVAFVGLAAPFFINSTSFLLSAVAAATLRYSRRPETESDAEKRLFGDLREGLRYVGRKGAVLAAMGVIVLINFVTAPISQFVPIIFSEILLASEAFAGLFMTLTVVGSIAGGVVSLGVERRGVSFAVVAAATLVTIGALILASVATRSVVAFSTLYFFAGLGGALIAVRAMTLIQRSVEPTFMGRVGSVVNMAFLAAAPLAAVVSGAVISARSMRFLLLVSSGLCVASAVGVLLTLRGLGEGNDLEPSGDVADT
jgi:predicted MFS family arabinose efflux permease